MNMKIEMILLTGLTLASGPLASAAPQNSGTEVAQARQILDTTGIKGGLMVHLGCGDGQLTAALHAGDGYLVQGLESDAKNGAHLQSLGLYGKVSVDQWQGNQLPYADNLVNLVVADNLDKLPMTEVMRVLAPNGVAWIGGKKTVKPWPPEIDEWQQHYHNADNNAVAKDDLVGPPRHFQWIAGPDWSRSHLCLPSINSMVSAGGRLFSIEDHASAEHPALPGKFALICRDAFNGIVLRHHPFADWQPTNIYIKYTPTQLQRQLVALADKVYCTPGLNAPITVFDAVTGNVLKSYAGTERTQEFAYDQGVLYVVLGDPFDTVGIGDDRNTIGPSAFSARAYGAVIPKLANPQSSIVALEADSGRELWRKEGDATRAYAGASLAVRGTHVAYCAADSLICLDRQTGAQRWRVPCTISLSGRNNNGETVGLVPGATVSLVLSERAAFLADSRKLQAFRLDDGTALWSQPVTINHFKSPDVFLANSLVWAAAYNASRGGLTPELGLNRTGANGFDPETGKLVTHLDQAMTGPMGHDRCYRNRITERYYTNTATGGTDFLALDGSGEFPHPWVRSTCGIGILPCNGLLYAGPPACSCANQVQLNAFNALASDPGLKSSGQPITVAIAPQLEQGPAYGDAVPPSALRLPPSDDWPTYRQDASRSGHTSAVVPAVLQPRWQTKFATHASPPTIAAGQVFAADVDAHAVCALSAADGKMQWTYAAGGRVDSPPTWHQGRLLFGSRDGWVYCLRATDGALVWRFKALPDRRMCAYEQIESAWPVCGSILVYNDVAYFAAGRNSFLDGGLFLFGLDPQTGRVLHQRHLYGPYGPNGQPVISPETAVGATGAGGIQGNKGDILLAENGHLFLRHQAFTPDLEPVGPDERIPPHLITSHGFIEAIPHHRSWWTIDTTLRYDIATGKGAVYGDILVRDGTRYYEVRGYPPARAEYFDPRLHGYTLFAGDLAKTGVFEMAAPGKKMAIAGLTAMELWSAHIAITGKAIALAGDVLFVAGTPVAFPEDDLAKAYEGRMGGILWAASTVTGQKLAEYKLDAAPVWDSMAVAGGRLYIATQDGKLRCFEGTK
jgi:outer membrane protein assembly factor BamB